MLDWIRRVAVGSVETKKLTASFLEHLASLWKSIRLADSMLVDVGVHGNLVGLAPQNRGWFLEEVAGHREELCRLRL